MVSHSFYLNLHHSTAFFSCSFKVYKLLINFVIPIFLHCKTKLVHRIFPSFSLLFSIHTISPDDNFDCPPSPLSSKSDTSFCILEELPSNPSLQSLVVFFSFVLYNIRVYSVQREQLILQCCHQ